MSRISAIMAAMAIISPTATIEAIENTTLNSSEKREIRRKEKSGYSLEAWQQIEPEVKSDWVLIVKTKNGNEKVKFENMDLEEMKTALNEKYQAQFKNARVKKRMPIPVKSALEI